MVIGKKALELKENRQLTFGAQRIVDAKISPDGKKVAYISRENGKVNLCLVKSTGGKVTTVMSRNHISNWPDVAKSDSGKGWCLGESVIWSPDSKMLAVLGRYVVLDGAGITQRDHIIVLARNGAHVASLPFPERVKFREYLVFSPDSARVAAKFHNPIADTGNDEGILVFRLDGSSEVAYTSDDYFEVLDWNRRGFLLIKEGLGRHASLARMWLDGSEPEKIDKAHRWLSPDGQLCVMPNQLDMPALPGLVVKNVRKDKTWVVAKGATPHSFREWLPNSRMIRYAGRADVLDQTQGRKKTLRSVWLADVTSTKVNTMCVALDHDTVLGLEPSWSDSCMKMAYVCDDRLYVAELGYREPTVNEKMAAGLKLSEEEEKKLLANHGKEIGLALQMYGSDYDGRIPSPDTVLEDLKLYIKSNDPYFRPGLQEVIFRYIAPDAGSWSDIQDQAGTVIGILDPGVYDWVIEIYADSRVKVVDK